MEVFILWLVWEKIMWFYRIFFIKLGLRVLFNCSFVCVMSWDVVGGRWLEFLGWPKRMWNVNINSIGCKWSRKVYGCGGLGSSYFLGKLGFVVGLFG